MTRTIYKLFLGKMTGEWHKLSENEQHDLREKIDAALTKAGGKPVIMCDPKWSTEQWHFWGVEEFPDIEAVMKHTQLLADLNWGNYVETMTVLGTKTT
jgi:hypothetical protein